MLLVYISRTNNIDKFVSKLNIKNTYKINPEKLEELSQDFWLITYTDKLGQIPDVVENFLIINNKHLKGVVASGNANFGNNFGRAGDLISQKYNVKLVLKFELSGSLNDVAKFKQEFAAVGGY